MKELDDDNAQEEQFISLGALPFGDDLGHLRITENSRLAIAAPAMNNRMTTRSRARVLCPLPPLAMISTVVAAIVAVAEDLVLSGREI
jgi:hypothetical protein